jgi:glycosyltransferase involved in cell wall biosynthesis
MKLLIAGNLANYGYFLAKLLRKNKINVDLLTRKDSQITEDPKSLDKNLTEYPNWIKFVDGRKIGWKLNILKLMRKYELIQASTEFPIFSYISQRQFISFTTGADIARLVQENSLKGILLRKAYHASKAVIIPLPHMWKYAQKLKLKNGIFIPALWDYEKFQTKIESTKNEKYTIFHPTNHVWYYKKNDRFLKAFLKLAEEVKNIQLIIINRGQDFKKSIKILEEPIKKNQVIVLPQTLQQSELVNYYHKSDVIVDQFGVGSTGLIGQEVMACGKPLVQYIDESLYEKFYSEKPPIFNAQSENEIYQQLSNLVNDPNLGKQRGMECQRWILKHHNHEKIIQKYIYLYNAVNDGVEFNKIKEKLSERV